MTQEELLIKFAQQTITPEEAALFRERLWQLSPDERRALESEYTVICAQYAHYGPIRDDWKSEMLQRVEGWEGLEFALQHSTTPTADLKSAASNLPDTYLSKVVSPVHRVHFLKTAWFRYAAALIFIAGTATFLYVKNKPQKEIVSILKQPMDILPGGNKAILTLADGSQIVLDSAANGNLASQGNTKIIKLDAGSLAYNGGRVTSEHPDALGGELLYNTISTPKGGQYRIVLQDGTKVWLNAASSLRFPTAFSSHERNVEVTGEAYFEINADAKRPFTVNAGISQILVLGTAFNINAYTNETFIRTTLIEGSVRVNVAEQSKKMIPGQQAEINKIGNSRQVNVVTSANLEQVMAWKNGIFDFEGAKLEAVMRQLERWYNIEVVYENGVPAVEFEGKISRNIKLRDLLKGLELSDVHFRMEEGRRLVVLP